MFEVVTDGWEINGDYHEYAFGSRFDKDGNIWITLCLTGSFNSSSKFRGWAGKVGTDGKFVPTTSGDTKAVIDLAKANDILLISPSATSPTLTNADDNGLLWRTAASDNLQSKVLAQIIMIPPSPSPVPRVNIAYADSAYGLGLDGAFIDSWTKASGTAPVSTVKYEEGSDPAVTVGKLADDTPDYSVIVADTDAQVLVAALSGGGPNLAATKFLFTDGAKGSDLLLNPDPSVLARVSGTGPATPTGVVYESFASTYKNQFGTDPADTAFVANAYDATYALSLCIAGLAGGVQPTGSALAAVLQRMSASGQLIVNVGPNGFTTGASALAAGGTIDLEGTSSHLSWDNATGDLTTAPIEVWTIDLTNPAKPTFKTVMVVTP